jgi:hypothetical protein
MSVEKDTVATASTRAPVPSPAVLDTMVNIIMGQTEMTHEEVVYALERTNYDLKKVIRDYMTNGNSSTENNVSSSSTASTNQLRFSEIRNFMDKSAELYYRRQEMTKIYNQVLERKKAEAALASAAAAGPSETVSKL